VSISIASKADWQKAGKREEALTTLEVVLVAAIPVATVAADKTPTRT
jgi:hypothetical protein